MNNYQVKVNNTQKYSDSQGEHIVHEGRLLFLTEQSPLWEDGALFREVGTNRIFRGDASNTGIQKNSTFEKIEPIIISEKEEIEVGDWVIDKINTPNKIQKVIPNDKLIGMNELPECGLHEKCYKVLALPEYFSDKHLQAIVDGKMRNEDEVYLKCDWGIHKQDGIDKKIHLIYLNSQNHITLFPAKQSLEEAAKQWVSEVSCNTDTLIKRGGRRDAFKAGYKKCMEDYGIK